ncbi:histidine kinase, partial [Candidatus Eisenbacteria bacterium]
FDRGKTSDIAEEIGHINSQLKQEDRPYLLIGPGRWGSADHWLGVPVTWAQISGVRCIVETDLEDMKVTPSQGSHFFQNITSFGIGYFTVGSAEETTSLDRKWLDEQNATATSEHVRHLRFDTPLEIVVDSRTRGGVVLKPGHNRVH